MNIKNISHIIVISGFIAWFCVFAYADVTQKLTEQERIQILIKIHSEYVTMQIPLPVVNKEGKAITIFAGKDIDRKKLETLFAKSDAAIMAGTVVQITGIRFEKDYIIFEISGGGKKGPKWYQRIQLGGGGGGVGGGQTQRQPVPNNAPDGQPDRWQPGYGSWIKLKFDKTVPSLTPDELKKLLAEVMKFGLPSATTNFLDSLPEEFREDVKAHRATVGMSRDLVLLAMGRPQKKAREIKDDGKQYEDWIYGEKPRKLTFVTFLDNVVVQVKEY